MKTSRYDTWMLSTPTARELFETYAKKLPVIDYHSHVDPREIAEDKRYQNLTELWLRSDHYKWRLMRAAGVEEHFITGEASDREKFDAWAGVLGRAVGNPLYDWSHLELKRYFGYEGALSEKTAEEVWNLTAAVLAGDKMTSRGLIARSGVELLCTTDDPVDSLPWHRKIKDDPEIEIRVIPTFRPDRFSDIEKPEFFEAIEELKTVCETKIQSLDDLERALKSRMDYFAEFGCRMSDHGMERAVYEPSAREAANRILRKRLAVMAGTLSEPDIQQYKTAMLQFFAREDEVRGWIMQLHFGCKRDINSAMYDKIGSNTGFDAIADGGFVTATARFMDDLLRENKLPRMILYSLNPNDNAAIDQLIGCFQSDPVAGRMQHGAAWWFNDHKRGIKEHLLSLASSGYLPAFIGMLTDSRCLLSYVRHEYFRRILCDVIGRMVEDGEFPDDRVVLGEIITDICHDNIGRVFEPGQPIEEELPGFTEEP